VTLATIEAAATESDRQSASTTARAGQGKRRGLMLPSISAAAALNCIARYAARMAQRSACRMFMRSMRLTVPIATPNFAEAMISA
jgi:hypothetical protein